MSLVGIDMGSSAVKAAAYTEDGKLMAEASRPLTPIRSRPGEWETDPLEVWEATSDCMRLLLAEDNLKRDPLKALAVSASGRENFLADADGNPLTNGVMGADVRGAEFENPPRDADDGHEAWSLDCGHLRQRMDPVFRLKWWKKHHPDLVDRARFFYGWMDFLVDQMTGHAAIDRSSASLYLTYDLDGHAWNLKRAADFEFGEEFLPDIPKWGTVIGKLKDDVAASWGAPSGVRVAQGCLDLNSAAYGAGVHEIGTVCLVSGSYENVLVPTSMSPTFSMLDRGLAFLAHPCKTQKCVIAVHPTGNAVLNWARALVGLDIEQAEAFLQEGHLAPSPVTAVPYLSGSMAYWKDGRKAKGGLVGLTLATSKLEVVQAFMEAIAYDIALTLSMMAAEGIEIERIRITGGGSRSPWWNQLKADVTGRPIEVVERLETGTFGAALLAGLAIGIFKDLSETSSAFAETKAEYVPKPQRTELHQERFADYEHLVQVLLDHVY